MFFPLITRPTRITSNTATLIDNIFTNNFDHFFCSRLLFTDISDHLPIFCIFYEHCADEDKRAYLIFREKKKTNILKFHDWLGKTNWSELKGYNDPLNVY